MANRQQDRRGVRIDLSLAGAGRAIPAPVNTALLTLAAVMQNTLLYTSAHAPVDRSDALLRARSLFAEMSACFLLCKRRRRIKGEAKCDANHDRFEHGPRR